MIKKKDPEPGKIPAEVHQKIIDALTNLYALMPPGGVSIFEFVHIPRIAVAGQQNQEQYVGTLMIHKVTSVNQNKVRIDV